MQRTPVRIRSLAPCRRRLMGRTGGLYPPGERSTRSAGSTCLAGLAQQAERRIRNPLTGVRFSDLAPRRESIDGDALRWYRSEGRSSRPRGSMRVSFNGRTPA